MQQLPERLLDELSHNVELHAAAVPVVPEEAKSVGPASSHAPAPTLTSVLNIALRKLDKEASDAWRRAAVAASTPGSPQRKERSLMPLLLRAFVERVGASGDCTFSEVRSGTELLRVEDAEVECFKEFLQRLQFAGDAAEAKALACREFLKRVTDVNNSEAVMERFRCESLDGFREFVL